MVAEGLCVGAGASAVQIASVGPAPLVSSQFDSTGSGTYAYGAVIGPAPN